MPPVNNVTRFLDSRKVSYTAFETPPEKLGALETAHLLNVEPASVYKTIVVTRDKPKKPLLVVVPGPSNVDLKLLASAVGEKKVHLPTEREAEQLTGLQAGGISPLALINKGFQVVIDSSGAEFSCDPCLWWATRDQYPFITERSRKTYKCPLCKCLLKFMNL